MEILQIKNLSFYYPNKNTKALDNINLTVKEGEFVVLLGQSGCGKTTLLKLIKKELAPFGKLCGDINYYKKDISSLDKNISAKEIGLVMQNPESQIVTDRVWHELAFGLESLGYDCETIKRKVAEISSYFGIEEWYEKRTDELSGGQKQLLNLASIVVMGPKLLLLDEPTAQLDPISANNFINTLTKINRELGLTIILVEHRLEEILPICDKAMLMDNGKIIFNDNPKKIVSYFNKNPNHPMIECLPTGTKIFKELESSGDAPLTVKEARDYIKSNYKNDIKQLKLDDYEHSKNEIVKLKNVYYKYDKNSKDVLRDVNFSIYENEHFCILGGNGAGKSTTLNIMSGLLKPYKGSVYINGKNIIKYKKSELYKNSIALLPQNPQALFIEDNVKDDLLEINNSSIGKIKETFSKLNIKEEILDMHPFDLSGGEAQKVALSKLLLTEPKILLLDEPTKGIDAYSKIEIAKIIKSLKSNGITIITVTHDIEFSASYADRCGLFFKGEMLSIDTPKRFFSQSNFYTTSASRISRDFYENAITSDDVIKLCKLNKGECYD